MFSCSNFLPAILTRPHRLHGSQLLSILKEHVQNLHHCQDNEDVSIQTGSTMDGDARIEYAMIVVLFAVRLSYQQKHSCLRYL